MGPCFLKRLDFANWGLPKELITDSDPKFLSKFWTALFTKKNVKLLYSIVYHLQTDGSSERSNQTVDIVLCFFIHTSVDPSCWPQVAPQIQSEFNNTLSSTTDKTLSIITYGFSLWQLFNLLALLPISDAYVACIDAASAILVIFANQKTYYNRKYLVMFIKIGDKGMLCFHKSYSISFFARIIQKLTQ